MESGITVEPFRSIISLKNIKGLCSFTECLIKVTPVPIFCG